MKIEKWLATVGLTSAMVFTPAIIQAAQSSSSTEAARLLKEMRQDARSVEYRAHVLETLSFSTETPWEGHAIELRRIKENVDDMGKRLNQLQAMQATAAPSQQQAISRVTPLVQFMAGNTTDAIDYMNKHQGGLWAEPYRQDVNRLRSEAATLIKTTHHPEAAAGD